MGQLRYGQTGGDQAGEGGDQAIRDEYIAGAFEGLLGRGKAAQAFGRNQGLEGRTRCRQQGRKKRHRDVLGSNVLTGEKIDQERTNEDGGQDAPTEGEQGGQGDARRRKDWRGIPGWHSDHEGEPPGKGIAGGDQDILGKEPAHQGRGLFTLRGWDWGAFGDDGAIDFALPKGMDAIWPVCRSNAVVGVQSSLLPIPLASTMSAREILLSERYGAAQTALAPDWNPIIEQMLSHRSVRAFLPDPVTEGQLEAMIAAAQSASSSSNLHAWSVVAVQDADRRSALAELAGGQAHIRQAPLQLVWLADLARLEQIAVQVGRPCAALDFLEMFLVAAIDAALAAQNAAVAAESLGLGTVYIGAMRNRPEDVARILGLPPKVVAVFGMCVGHPDPASPASIKPRPAQPVVLHRETYSPDQAMGGVPAYDAAMTAFYAAQGMKVHGTWSVHSAKRIAGPDSLSGRDRLVEALRNLGFPLR